MERPVNSIIGMLFLCFAATHAPSAAILPAVPTGTAATQASVEVLPAAEPTPEFVKTLKGIIDEFVTNPRSPVRQRLIAAKVSPDCTVGLVNLLRAISNMEPWAFRLLDATGKYPTGIFHGTLSDLGAFDECIETVVRDFYGREMVRAQYCNVYLSGNDTALLRYIAPAINLSHRRALDFATQSAGATFVEGIRIGICFINDCDQHDIKSLLDAMVDADIDITVKDCVTSESPPVTKAQKAVVALLGGLAVTIFVSSAIDLYMKGVKANRGFAAKVLTAFSVRENVQILFNIVKDQATDAYMYRFLHGLRFFSMFMIVIGHSYNIFDFVNTSRMVNALHYADNISFSLVMTGYLSVDVFFFISGFLLVHAIEPKRTKLLLTGIIGIIRRHIRTTAPVFFVMVCCLLIPQVVSGPNVKPLMEKFCYEFYNQWWHILLQIRNVFGESEIGIFGHLWFISADFQLFLVALPTLLILKRFFWPVMTAFLSFGLLCCSITAWQVFNTPYPPFITPIVADVSILLGTLNYVYVLPFYHGICYYSGCMTCLLVKRYRHTKISKAKQLGMWCLTLTCALACLFLKYDWNRGRGPTQQWIKIPLCFIDRLMWSVCISWTVFACATRRGGPLCSFLSWKAFVPLSRLCFGIYIVHVPFFFIKSNMARERIFYSHFTLVLQTFGVFVASSLLSLAVYFACEAPVGRLEKLFLMRSDEDKKARENFTGKEVGQLKKNPCSFKGTESGNRPEQTRTKEDISRL